MHLRGRRRSAGSPPPAARRRAQAARFALVFAAWGAVGYGWFRLQRQAGGGPVTTMQQAIGWARNSWWALPAFLVAGMARPLVLFPATLLTVAAGILFGPLVGFGAAAVVGNGSALLAYGIGRLLGPSGFAGAHPAGDHADDGANADGRNGHGGSAAGPTADPDVGPAGALASWSSRLRANSFEAVLVMRLLFLPYDAVNYAAGFLRVRWRPFLAATALGSLPGTFAFVLAGSSLERLDGTSVHIDPTAVAASAIVLSASLILARVLRRRHTPATGTAGG